MRIKELAKFIIARENARIVRHGVRPGEGNQLTHAKLDPIIAKYRFCNMIRADDRVTKDIWEWVRENGFDKDPDLWFALVVARLFNNKPTLNAIRQLVLPFKPAALRRILHGRKAAGIKNFNAAYIVSTNGIAMDKVDYLLDRVLAPIWAARKAFRPKLLTAGNKQSKNESLRYEPWSSYHAKLQSAQGLGSFMAAQIVADLKYFPPFFSDDLGIPTAVTEDWWTFAASGPGSRRGLNRMLGNPVEAGWNETKWRETLAVLYRQMPGVLPFGIGSRLTAQDLQNCLCEFDKYERARLGEGEPKQIYTPFIEEK